MIEAGCVVHMQIIASGSSVYAIPWPPSFLQFMSSLRVFMVDVISITKANCAAPMDYYNSLLVLLLGLKIVLLALALGPLLASAVMSKKVRGCWRRRRQERQQQRQERCGGATRRASAMTRDIQPVTGAGSTAGSSTDWVVKVFRASFVLLFVAYPGEATVIVAAATRRHAWFAIKSVTMEMDAVIEV